MKKNRINYGLLTFILWMVTILALVLLSGCSTSKCTTCPQGCHTAYQNKCKKPSIVSGGLCPNVAQKYKYGNPFAEFSHDELVLAYVNFSCMKDVEAIDLIVEMYDIDTYIDLTPFGISTRDFA